MIYQWNVFRTVSKSEVRLEHLNNLGGIYSIWISSKEIISRITHIITTYRIFRYQFSIDISFFSLSLFLLSVDCTLIVSLSNNQLFFTVWPKGSYFFTRFLHFTIKLWIFPRRLCLSNAFFHNIYFYVISLLFKTLFTKA